MSHPLVEAVTPPPLSPSSSSLRRTPSSASSDLHARDSMFATAPFAQVAKVAEPPSSRNYHSKGNVAQHHRNGAGPMNTTSGQQQASKDQMAPSYGSIEQEEIKHGMPAQLQEAPSADFSVQTKSQNRDPSLMQAAAQAQMLINEKKRQAREFNYMQRDTLMEEARQAALGSGNHDWIVLMDLARLASQHQLSPYSVMKFGFDGSPFAYVPITLQQPTAVDQTMKRQQQSEKWAINWLMSKKRKRSITASPELPQEKLLNLKLPNGDEANDLSSLTTSIGVKRPASVTTPTKDERARTLMRTESGQGQGVEERISQAMSDRIAGPPSASSSEESLALDQDVEPSLFDRSTTMFELKDGQRESDPDSVDSSTKHMGQPDQGGQEVLNTKVNASSEITVVGPMDDEVVKVQDREKPAHAEQPGHAGAQPQPVASMPPSRQAHLAMKTSDTHPIHISPVIPENLLKDISRKIIPNVPSRFIGAPHASGDAIKLAPSLLEPETHARLQQSGERLVRLDNIVDLVAISEPCGYGVPSQAQIVDQAEAESAATVVSSEDSTPCIGNLLLSSCPGKKVRLSGPVRRRGAICRDLGLDLKRIHGLGIRAIICCLDDKELAFLGAPWPEYEMEADQLGLDVIRMPMAEGFAPSNVTAMDAVITAMIMDYTLRGTSVLVHCRGGVGRAGLIACTWMLKMGLAGPDPMLKGVVEDPHVILNTVERLITTIRRRRSPKAIETAEQVKFIVEYVTYLHKQER